MSELSTEELRVLAREVFGRDLGDAEVEACRPRLPTMVRNVRTIRERARHLGAIEPALVPQPPKGDDRG